MFKYGIKVDDFKKLDKLVDFVDRLESMKTDEDFQNFIQHKCLETVDRVSRERIYLYNTTNTEMREEYLRNNKILVEKDGFVIYNDTYVTTNNPSYEGGRFSIALAFEYGVGIIGEENPIEGAWTYDVNGNLVYDEDNDQYIRGWWISKLKNGNNPYVKENEKGTAVITQGYRGMEIYRYARIQIENLLPKWVSEYFRRKLNG